MFACQVPEFPRVADPQPVRLKALTYNVWHGLSQATFKMKELEPPGQKEARIQWQITQIKALDPDIVFLQEVNPVSVLSQRLAAALAARGQRVAWPPPEFCTDNGAMIAYAGLLRLRDPAARGGLEFRARARWPLDELAPVSAAT